MKDEKDIPANRQPYGNWTEHVAERKPNVPDMCVCGLSMANPLHEPAMNEQHDTPPSVDCPALHEQSEHYPASWHGRVPKTIRMAKRVTADLTEFFPENRDMVAMDSAEYPAHTNKHGAVSAVLPSGKQLGVKPYEFEIVEWHAAPKSGTPCPVCSHVHLGKKYCTHDFNCLCPNEPSAPNQRADWAPTCDCGGNVLNQGDKCTKCAGSGTQGAREYLTSKFSADIARFRGKMEFTFDELVAELTSYASYSNAELEKANSYALAAYDREVIRHREWDKNRIAEMQELRLKFLAAESRLAAVEKDVKMIIGVAEAIESDCLCCHRPCDDHKGACIVPPIKRAVSGDFA